MNILRALSLTTATLAFTVTFAPHGWAADNSAQTENASYNLVLASVDSDKAIHVDAQKAPTAHSHNTAKAAEADAAKRSLWNALFGSSPEDSSAEAPRVEKQVAEKQVPQQVERTPPAQASQDKESGFFNRLFDFSSDEHTASAGEAMIKPSIHKEDVNTHNGILLRGEETEKSLVENNILEAIVSKPGVDPDSIERSNNAQLPGALDFKRVNADRQPITVASRAGTNSFSPTQRASVSSETIVMKPASKAAKSSAAHSKATPQNAPSSALEAAVQPDPLMVFDFDNNRLYTLQTQANKVTTITLEAGEELHSFFAGDEQNWDISQSTSGEGKEARTHIMIKPLKSGLDSHIIATTSRRVYRMNIESGDAPYMAAVQWLYPDA